jgi:Mrp family chromosome partitioning ATPase
MIVCWAAKGGSGTTVTACVLALEISRRRRTVLVDLHGDVPLAMGMSGPSGPGIAEWMRSATADARALADLIVPVTAELDLLPTGDGPRPSDQWARLAGALAELDAEVVVDAGSGSPPAPIVEQSVHSLLVTRACYLALARAAMVEPRPTGVVLVCEPGRALGVGDVESALGVPVLTSLALDPAVARAVDAGLLRCRLPASTRRAVRILLDSPQEMNG